MTRSCSLICRCGWVWSRSGSWSILYCRLMMSRAAASRYVFVPLPPESKQNLRTTPFRRSTFQPLQLRTHPHQPNTTPSHTRQSYANELGLGSSVEWCVNAPFSDLKQLLGGAVGGLHSMTDEHFGISVVEYMAAGAWLVRGWGVGGYIWQSAVDCGFSCLLRGSTVFQQQHHKHDSLTATRPHPHITTAPPHPQASSPSPTTLGARAQT